MLTLQCVETLVHNTASPSEKVKVLFTSTSFDVFNETEIRSKATSPGQDADFALLWLHWILYGDSLYYLLRKFQMKINSVLGFSYHILMSP